MIHVNSPPLSLAAIERLTGLSREVLRKWELRYAFPQPHRGARGERMFTAADAVKLQLIGQLIARGKRPAALVRLDVVRLQQLLQHALPTAQPAPAAVLLAQWVPQLLARLHGKPAPSPLMGWLQELVDRLGLETFTAHLMPVFNQAVGDAWQRGELPIHAEHHYTEAMQQVVIQSAPQGEGVRQHPAVLLSTPPGELHLLGLLALATQLRLAGANVISLGGQTPATDLLAAANQHGCAVIGLSLSPCIDVRSTARYLRSVRQGLPTSCALWLGGAGCSAFAATDLQGCDVFGDTSQAVLRWRTLAANRPDQTPARVAGPLDTELATKT